MSFFLMIIDWGGWYMLNNVKFNRILWWGIIIEGWNYPKVNKNKKKHKKCEKKILKNYFFNLMYIIQLKGYCQTIFKYLASSKGMKLPLCPLKSIGNLKKMSKKCKKNHKK